MPIPKSLIAQREEVAVSSDCLGAASSANNDDGDGATRPVPTMSSSNRTVFAINKSESKEHVVSRKKRPVVKWRSDVQGKSEAKDDDNHNFITDKKRTANRSPSPSSSLTLLELEEHIKKQEASIRSACELELKLLNQCTRVREKRSRMVQRLRKLKRSMQKLANEDKWTVGRFPFPPEYEALKLAPYMVDMTQHDEVVGTS